MVRGIVLAVLAVVLAFPVSAEDSLVLYSGRKKNLVGPLIKQFEKKTGIKVQVKYGKTAQMAMLIQEEGANSPADLFWGQDAGAMGALSKRFVPLAADLTGKVPERFRAAGNRWVPVSGRARVIAYSPERAKTLPKSVFDLTKPEYKGRVGWAPTNASFQAFVTALRVAHGEAKAEAWLKGMKANGAKVYPKNTPIIQALAAGEIDLGLPNHYYLLRFLAKDPKFPVKQSFFAPGDIGNLVNVAGVGVLAKSKKQATALKLVAFLLSAEAQTYFVTKTYEYPMLDSIAPAPQLAPSKDLLGNAPAVKLDQIADLDGTLKLLRKVGLL
ncbi:MAG: iron ABC transporter substrate-binding protein [Planctomycetota bacterium]|jgi:iron(III) transport system substrate-binding protein